MNADRLLKLADHLERVVAHLPPERFDMLYWSRPLGCGTAACAVGHACQIPEFAAAGLGLVWDEDNDAEPVFGDSRAWTAVGRFFDIDHKTAARLFDSWEYSVDGISSPRPTPQEVAARIRDAVAQHTIIPTGA